jgi:hypothetical protein
MPTILAPMVADSRMENYAYITIVLKPATPAGVLTYSRKGAVPAGCFPP